MIEIEKILPVWKVESGAMISMFGDVTIAYEVTLPVIGTQAIADFEAGHQAFVKAIRVLTEGTVLHKADWFQKSKVQPLGAGDVPGQAADRFFKGRTYLDHQCYIFLTQKPAGRKLSSSGYSNILRKSIAPVTLKDERLLAGFYSACGQFERILMDSGCVGLRRLGDEELAGTANKPGIIEKYCFLLGRDSQPLIRDIHIKDEIRIGDKYCQLYTLADALDLPALCGPRINYDKYSTDKTKYSIGFATPLGQLLDCDHVYNQFIFIGDAQKTIKRLEAKKLRLQSLSAYSRENAVGRDACNDFLNEAVATQKLPVKAHFNVLAWTDNRLELPELKNKVASAMAVMDAVCKEETDGAPQIWFSGMPGNQGDFPMNDCFDTFAEQAACFLNMGIGQPLGYLRPAAL